MVYLSYESLELDRHYMVGLRTLHDSIFGMGDSAKISRELMKKPAFLINLALEDGLVVGYKIGFEERTGRFYSWLGGVHPAMRAQGVGGELLRRQHEWCIEHGYTKIRTHTKNRWREMLVLNIKAGYDVIGTFTDESGESRIILEKEL